MLDWSIFLLLDPNPVSHPKTDQDLDTGEQNQCGSRSTTLHFLRSKHSTIGRIFVVDISGITLIMKTVKSGRGVSA